MSAPDRTRPRRPRRGDPSCSGRRCTSARRRCGRRPDQPGRRTAPCRRGGRRSSRRADDQPAGVLTVPFGVVEVCQADQLTEPQSKLAVPPRFGSRTSWPSSSSSASSRQLDDRHDRGAGSLRDRDGVAEVIAVPWVSTIASASTSSAAIAALGLPLRNGSMRTVVPVVLEREGRHGRECVILRLSPPFPIVLVASSSRARARRRRRQASRAASPLRRASSPRGALPPVLGGRRFVLICFSCASPNHPPSSSAALRIRCSPGAACVTTSCAWPEAAPVV